VFSLLAARSSCSASVACAQIVSKATAAYPNLSKIPYLVPCPGLHCSVAFCFETVYLKHVGRHRLGRNSTRLPHRACAHAHMCPAGTPHPHRARRYSKSNRSSSHLGSASGGGPFSFIRIFCRSYLTLPQALKQQLSVMQAAVRVPHPPAFEMKPEPAFCSESDILRQRAALLTAEEARISAAVASVPAWTMQQHEQLKAVSEDLPLAGTLCVCELAEPNVFDAQPGFLATTLLHTAAMDECATAAAADVDELAATAGRLKQSNGSAHRRCSRGGIVMRMPQASCSSCGMAC
jgi:hypothetical protein